MKVRITHLKAPWPAGAQVGDVIEMVGFYGELPGWATGKCKPVEDDVEASQVLERVAPAILPVERPASELLIEAKAKIEALTAELAETQAAIAKLQDGKAAGKAKA
jgi:hypothetical protein